MLPLNAVVLNFRTAQVDILSLSKMEDHEDAYEYIEEKLNYDLTDCQWMVVVGELDAKFSQ